MPLRFDVGSALKHYRILSLLGRGGMGEVYAAEDTRLGRKVAIKCLPPRVAEDADRLRRFTQEAKAASALNHPSILTIHDVDNVEGQPFLVTELIDGETLRERLQRGGMSPREALDIVSQIANALAAAHAAGLVHRDVKPENVMVREDGLVKLLDFGLVKIATEASPNDETVAVGPETMPGVVMGTTQYMSPEQARGLKVDARSDIFSLGVMLYEMAAGRPPFRGDTHSDLIAAILHFEPAPIAEAPPDLARLLSKALEKDRDERYQTAKDLAVDLRRMRKRLDASNDAARLSPGTAGAAWSSTPSAGAPSAAATPASSVATPPPGTAVGGRRRSPLLWVALAVAAVVVVTAVVVVLLGVGGIGVWLKGVRPPATASLDNMVVEKLAGLGQVSSVAMSHDGRFLAYVRNEGSLATIWVRQMATGSVVRVSEPTDRRLSMLQLTPDGEHLYYTAGTTVRPFRGELMAIPTFGGKARTVLEGLWDRPSFAPDGKRFAAVYHTEGATQLMMANADGSQATVMTTQDFSGAGFNSAAWSPSGRQIAVATTSRSTSGATAGIRVIPVEGGEGRSVTLTGMTAWQVRDLSWTTDETTLLASVTTSLDAPVQLVRIRIADGHTERITRDANSYDQLAFSRASGIIGSVQREALGSIWIGAADRLAEAREVPSRLSDNDGLRGLDWLDDTRLVFTRVHDVSSLWTIDDTGANARQLSEGFRAMSPLTSPDRKFVLFSGDRDSPGVFRLFRLDLTDGRIVAVLGKMTATHPSLSYDGRTLYFHDGRKVFKTPLAGGPLTPLFESPNVSHTVASPDDRWIAVRTTPPGGGRRELVLIPVAGGAPRVIYTSLESDISFRWYPQSEALLLMTGGTGRNTIFRLDLAGGAPRQLAQFTRGRVVSPVLSPDGKRIAFYRGTEENSIVLLKPGGRQ